MYSLCLLQLLFVQIRQTGKYFSFYEYIALFFPVLRDIRKSIALLEFPLLKCVLVSFMFEGSCAAAEDIPCFSFTKTDNELQGINPCWNYKRHINKYVCRLQRCLMLHVVVVCRVTTEL